MRGLHVPIITPFDDRDGLDEDALEGLADNALEAGAAGLVALGTTGEAAALDRDEQARVIARCRAACDRHGATLTIGAGTAVTRDSVAQVVERQELADALLVLAPYYLRPSDDGVVRHFEAVAAVAERPLLIYNIPYRTGKELSSATLLRLLAIDGVVGLKHCAGAIDVTTLEMMAGRGESAVLGGDDAFLQPLLALGGCGGICASGNVLPAAFAQLVELMAGGELAASRRLHERLLPAVRALFAEPSPAVIKAVLHRQGLIGNPSVREPLTPASSAATEAALASVQAVAALAPR
jgi:4-hydroxy-tetrahydrodipicolinate synthase